MSRRSVCTSNPSVSDGEKSGQPVHSGQIGRAREIARLASLITSADATCSTVHVSGEPGVGKTHLVESAVRSAGLNAVWCTADRLGQRQPLEALWRGLGLPGTSEVDLQAAAEAVSAEIGRRLDGGPTALIIDDVHWCDDLSFRLLPRLVNRFGQQPLVLVTAGYRPVGSDAWRLLSTLSSRCPSTELSISPLTPSECVALAGLVLGQQNSRALEACWRTSGGNPRILLTMAETLRGEMIGPDSRLPTVLPLSQIPHLAHITSDCLRLLEYAAVLGDPFDARQLGALAATSFTDVVTILDEAIAVGLLDETHDGFVFRHDVIHDTLAKEVPTSVRAELHRRCARDLTEYGHDPARVAAHLLGTGLSTSDHDWVRTVAERCVTAAPDRVIPLWRHYSDCAEFDGPRDHRRIEVEVQIAVALLSLGRAKEAEEAARTVLDLMGARDARVTSCLAVALMLQGKYEEARSIAASASVAEELQPWERAEQLALAGAAALLMGDVSVATDELDRAEVGAARAGSAVARIRVLISRGHLAHRRGELARARVLLEEAAALCAGDDSRAGHETFAHAMYGLVLADQDNADDADRAFRQGEEFGLSRGSLITTRFSQVCRALSDVDLGRLDRAIPALDRDLAEPDDITELWQSALLARRALAALYCEGPDAAEHWVRCLLERDWYTSDEYGTAWRPRAVAAVKLARGDVEDAVSVLWCAWQEVMAAGLLIDTRLLATELVDASRRTHDPTKAWNVVEAMEELAGRNPDVPSLAVQLLTVRGMVD